jgi:hypothetical protein
LVGASACSRTNRFCIPPGNGYEGATELVNFTATPRAGRFGRQWPPLVSIIIPVYGKPVLTFNCLKNIMRIRAGFSKSWFRTML